MVEITAVTAVTGERNKLEFCRNVSTFELTFHRNRMELHESFLLSFYLPFETSARVHANCYANDDADDDGMS